MPELPEVETMRRGLQATVLGLRIESVTVLWRPSFDVAQARIDALVSGHNITAVRRRGKVLLLDLDDEQHVLVHPKMTGQLVVVKQGTTVFAGGHPSHSMLGPMPNTTTRVVLALSTDTALVFNDQRKFGWIRLVDTASLAREEFLSRLGPEPLSGAFTCRAFRERLAHHRGASIKAVILDQSTVAGVGNVYTDESLHLARIDPRRRAGSLTTPEVARLHDAIVSVIGGAVEHGGTSFVDYVNDFRGSRTYLAQARVFGREGQPCEACGTAIQRIRVAGRGTNICPHCQRYLAPRDRRDAVVPTR
ncbi:MAG: bifunctional DNA-formamidopyrimidine glycosylase/DNA-(apurinic or apyrimidinic site) lyase [Jatrophihabitantaceae bacterium]